MTTAIVPAERIEQSIYVVRGHRVMLDADLAALYGVETKALNQAVKRNIDRFPDDFMFRLTKSEWASLRSQTVTTSGRGGRRSPPYAFTEQGVAMLSSVLRSDRAVHVNIEIMRTFVRLRKWTLNYAELAKKLTQMERKYDAQFRAVFKAIRTLLTPTPSKPRRIGFRTEKD